jgi:hypothetical protein
MRTGDRVPNWVIGAGSIAVALTVFFLVKTADPNAAPRSLPPK